MQQSGSSSDEVLEISAEPIYSTPKATGVCVPQYQANLQTYLASRNTKILSEDKGEFTGPDSLPKFLPPSKPHFPSVPSPAQKRCRLLSSQSESEESDANETQMTGSDLLPSQVQVSYILNLNLYSE